MEKQEMTASAATPNDDAKVQKIPENTNNSEDNLSKGVSGLMEEYNRLPDGKAETQPQTQEERFQVFLKKGWFDDLDETITRPNFHFNILGVDSVPRGGIVGIAGKPGAGKSTTLAILIGILFGRTEFAGVKCLNPCHKVLWVDTEKDAYSCSQKMKNFRRVANVEYTKKLTDIGVHFSMMMQESTKDRLYFISRLAQMEQYDAVVIDGIFDLTENPNEDFSGIIDLQRKLASTGATVFAMLHTNKADGDNNMRYALGTEEQRIITTRFLIQFNESTKCHIIKMDKSNDSALAPEVSFMFDAEGRVVAKTEGRQIDVKQILLWVFQDGQSRDWNKLRADFRAKSGVSASETFLYCQQAQKDGLLCTELDGNLNLNKDYF